ncbi:MAG: ABC transporter permease [Myxococcota bacterium]|nr:ABC transporter permease [Myxococcota bacterium]
MRGLILVAKRELGAYLNTSMGYVIVAIFLMLEGLFFNAFAVGSSPKASADVLSDFFYFSFGCTVAAAVFLSMRLIAEERQTGTIVLVQASPLANWQLVGGKFLSVLVLLAVMMLISTYMPALIFVNGKVSLGQIGVGYLGVFLASASAAAIGTFGSTLARSQLVAVIISGVIVVALLLAWLLGRVTDPPLDEVWSYLSLYDRHFQPFQKGRLNTEDVVFYLSMCFGFLMLSTRTLSARRWK